MLVFKWFWTIFSLGSPEPEKYFAKASRQNNDFIRP